MTTDGVTRRHRAEYWLEVAASLCDGSVDAQPAAVVARALTLSFDATATAHHVRRGVRVTQTVHDPDPESPGWTEADRFARTRAATDHPLLAYYLATGDARAHDLDGVPWLVDARVAASWREVAASRAAHHQIAVPVEHGPGRHTSFVIGRGEPFAREDLAFARRLQGLVRGLVRPAPPAVSSAADPHGVGLTPRETAVLGAVADGLTADAAARRLGISPRTVHKHLERTYAKLGVTDRVSAVLRAGRLGLL